MVVLCRFHARQDAKTVASLVLNGPVVGQTVDEVEVGMGKSSNAFNKSRKRRFFDQ